jgi:hypothetical protein
MEAGRKLEQVGNLEREGRACGGEDAEGDVVELAARAVLSTANARSGALPRKTGAASARRRTWRSRNLRRGASEGRAHRSMVATLGRTDEGLEVEARGYGSRATGEYARGNGTGATLFR